MWVLRIEHRSSRRTARTLNPWAISPAPTGLFSVAAAISQTLCWISGGLSKVFYVFTAKLFTKELSNLWLSLTSGCSQTAVQTVILDIYFFFQGSGGACLIWVPLCAVFLGVPSQACLRASSHFQAHPVVASALLKTNGDTKLCPVTTTTDRISLARLRWTHQAFQEIKALIQKYLFPAGNTHALSLGKLAGFTPRAAAS